MKIQPAFPFLLVLLCASFCAQAQLTATVSPTCVGQFPANICAQTSGGGACQFQWSNGQTSRCVTATAPGQYCVTVTACNGATTVACADVCAKPVATISPKVIMMCLGNCTNLTVMSNGTGFNYDWGPALGNSQTINVCPGVTTTYTVTVTNASGCSRALKRKVKITDCPGADGCDVFASLDDEDPDNEAVAPETETSEPAAEPRQLPAPTVKIQPNPTNGFVRIDCSGLVSPVVEALVLDATGRVVRHLQVPVGGVLDVDLSALPPGVYVVNVGGFVFEKLTLTGG